jgi:MFS family permease
MLCRMARATWQVNRLATLIDTLRSNEVMLTLSIMIVVNMIGFGMITPVLPIFGRSFGVSSAMVGLLVTAFGFARLFANLPSGRLSDRIGRRPVLVMSPVIVAIGGIASALAPTCWIQVATRFVQGICSAMFATGAITCLADVSTAENRGRTMAVYQGSLLIGTSLGPTVGGLVAHALGLRAVFFFYAGLSLTAAFWAFMRLPETLPEHKRRGAPAAAAGATAKSASGASAAISLLTNPAFLAVSSVSLVIFFTRTGSRSTIVPLIASERLGMPEPSIGLLLTVASIFNVLTLPLSAWAVDRFGRKTVILPSMVMSTLALLAYAAIPRQSAFYVAAGLDGIGTGIAGPAPAAYAANVAKGQNYGTTMGMFRTMSDIGFVAGPVLLGALADYWSFAFALYVNAALVMFALVMFALFATEPRAEPIPQAAPAEVPSGRRAD